jgi:hypothetical protein
MSSSLRGLRVLVCGLLLATAAGACSAIANFDGLVGASDAAVESGADAAVDATVPDMDAGTTNEASVDADATLDYPDGSVLFGGHAYMLVITSSPISWDNARSAATAAGGHLATLTTQAESDFVEKLVADTPAAVNSDGNGPLLGGYQPSPGGPSEPDGGWVWVTGEPWTFTDWGNGQPDNTAGREDYLELYQDRWNDIENLEGVQSYLIEFE